MSRLRHHLAAGIAYLVTVVTAERKVLFADPSACRFFITCMDYQKQILRFRLHGFVLMPEHFHGIVHPSNEVGISEILKHLKGNFARKYNLIIGAEGHVWQRRFHLKGIRDPSHLLSELAYCHNNPVRAGLVRHPGDYEYSSYRYYYGNAYRGMIDRFDGGTPMPLCVTSPGRT